MLRVSKNWNKSDIRIFSFYFLIFLHFNLNIKKLQERFCKKFFDESNEKILNTLNDRFINKKNLMCMGLLICIKSF